MFITHTHKKRMKREREEIHVKKKEKKREIPIMSWVTPLTDRLLIGPLPYTLNEVLYLTKVKKVNLFVNLLTEKGNGYEKYLKNKDMLHNFPLDMTKHDIRGRLKSDQQKSTALIYIELARSIVTLLSAASFVDKVVYIHSKSGFMDEAFIGFAVWQLIATATVPFPVDPLAWIAANHYKMLLDDDYDNKEVLKIICAEIKTIKHASKFFIIKKK